MYVYNVLTQKEGMPCTVYRDRCS